MHLIGQASAAKPHGLIVETTLDGTRIEADTLQCCHCGMHWRVVKGSGTTRGFCLKCMGPTCGSQRCSECVPYEKQLGGQ